MSVFGESEKSRLQRIFEWSNRGIGTPKSSKWRDNDQPIDEEVQWIQKQRQGSINKQKRWLDILANEVVERETVLKVMRAEGQKQLSKEKLKLEIQERIKHMKELQNNIARQERQDKQNKMEVVLADPTKCCQATHNVQKEKNKIEGKIHGGYSSNSKRLLEHNLNTSEKPQINHRRYKHSNSPPTLSTLLLHRLESISPQFVTQTKGNHHYYKENHHRKGNHNHKENYYHKENHHGHHYIESSCHNANKQLDDNFKMSKPHRTRCQNANVLKNKIVSRL